MKWMHLLYACVVAAAVSPNAVATNRYFLDSSAISPNGRYRINAKSPDNAWPPPRPFAASFTYTLTDTSTKKTIWTRKQPMTREKGSAEGHPTEGSPVELFVNDDGLVAARLETDSLLLLEPSNGRKRTEAEILEAFSQSERDDYLSDTSAGPSWSQDSDWFFLALPVRGTGKAAVYFVVRPYWNRRLIVDTATGTHVDLRRYRDAASVADLADADEDIKRLLTATIDEETRHASAAVTGAAERLRNNGDYHVYWKVRAGLHTVGFLKLAQAEPQLRQLEVELDSMRDDLYELRPKVRETIRSIGKTPAAGYGVRLYPLIHKGSFYEQDTERPYRTHVPVDERVVNATKIVTGMSAEEVTELLGCPDADLYANTYDYDIDAPMSYTLRVVFNRHNENVVSVTTVTPFAFLHDKTRMRRY